MQTVGYVIKNARVKKDVTTNRLGDMTHIKTSFIEAIEEGRWERLPDFNVTLGFVKTIAHFLDIDELTAVSLFRREYPPSLRRKEIIAGQGPPRRKSINKRFVWGPRMTFLTGVLIIILVVLGYLGFQYRKFNGNPTLNISEPIENAKVTAGQISVKGTTDPDVTIIINNQPIVVNDNGSFSAQIDVNSSTKEVVVDAKTRAGKSTEVKRKIIVTQR